MPFSYLIAGKAIPFGANTAWGQWWNFSGRLENKMNASSTWLTEKKYIINGYSHWNKFTEPVNELSEKCTPMVIMPKPFHEAHICLAMSTFKDIMEYIYHPMPAVDNLASCKIFKSSAKLMPTWGFGRCHSARNYLLSLDSLLCSEDILQAIGVWFISKQDVL